MEDYGRKCTTEDEILWGKKIQGKNLLVLQIHLRIPDWNKSDPSLLHSISI